MRFVPNLTRSLTEAPVEMAGAKGDLSIGFRDVIAELVAGLVGEGSLTVCLLVSHGRNQPV